MWKELFRLTGTKLCVSSAFHPQTDGQSEVTNRIIVVYLRCLAGDRSCSWLRWLPWAEYCYNTSYQSALKTTPFEVVYGRAPPQMLPYQEGSTRLAAVDHQLRDRDQFLTEIKERLLQAQALMKCTHDKQHRELKFAVGDWVWLRLNHRAASSVRQGDKSKLGAKYFGPYMVLECIGDVSYKLQLPPQARIHNVFHVSFLKKFQDAPPATPPALPPLVRGRLVLIPDKIIHTKPTATSWELLVRWQGCDAAEASWMSSSRTSCFTRQGGVLWTPSGPSILGSIRSRLRNRIPCNQEDRVLVGLLEPIWLIPSL
jgi:hypothetical protein